MKSTCQCHGMWNPIDCGCILLHFINTKEILRGINYMCMKFAPHSSILFVAAVLRYVSEMVLNIKLITNQQGRINTPYLTIKYNHVLDQDEDANSTVSVSSSVILLTKSIHIIIPPHRMS